MAFDSRLLSTLLSPRLASGVTISAVVPQRAHLTKDGRLMVAYRVQLFHPRTGLSEVPVFLHNTTQSRIPSARIYRDAAGEVPGERDRLIRRLYIKAGPASFLSVFPLDPELRTPIRLLRPAELIECYNAELKLSGSETATAVEMKLLGYRPERRAILKVRALALATERTIIVKLYRRSEAGRIWNMCNAIAPQINHLSGVTRPLAHSPEYGALSYAFRGGETLHHLLEQGWATHQDLHQAGQLLRQFHTSVSAYDVPRLSLRTFTFRDEWEILNRWRRFLKHSGSPHAGLVAKYVRILSPDTVTAPGPDALVHRDFYPKQLLVHPWTRDLSLIDLDTTAFGPAALDVGNFFAHLHLHSAHAPSSMNSRRAFLEGYGTISEKDVCLFELTSVVRIFCLAIVSPPVPGLLEQLRNTARGLERSFE